MAIVTLTSDLGERDFFLAAIKGTLLSVERNLSIISISSNVKPYDIVQAAFLLRNSWWTFPAGTIHLVTVNDLASADQAFLVARKNGHFFVAPDNGLFALLFDQPCDQVRRLEARTPFRLEHLFDYFRSAVGHILAHSCIDDLGEPVGATVRRLTLQPITGPDLIRGSIIYIDRYENAVTNISRQLFEQVSRHRPFFLHFRRHDPIDRLSENYFDVPVGQVLCRFNTAGLLEIAINMDRAASLLNLQFDDSVEIKFYANSQ